MDRVATLMPILGLRDGVYYHYLRLINVTTDWDTLCEIAEQLDADSRLSDVEKDRLLVVVDGREIAVRSWLPGREST